MGSRWANSTEDARIKARKDEKAEKKRRLKHDKKQLQQNTASAQPGSQLPDAGADTDDANDRATKRRCITVPPSHDDDSAEPGPLPQLRFDGGTFGPPGDGWGAYEKMNAIGEGTYGAVIRVRRLANGKIFAIKRLKPEKMGKSLTMSLPITGMREIQILKNCEHRNVVKMVDVVSGSGGASIDGVSIVLEFVEHDLHTILHTMPQPFQPSEVKTLMLQLLQGLDYLHSNWILHRDLKTPNILLNNRGVLKIADFGMARYIGDPLPRDLTRHIVTLWYRAPELLLGAKTYTAAIDMWSVGCIFYEIIQGRPLFQQLTEASIMQAILSFCGPWSPHRWPDLRRLPSYKLYNLAALEFRDARPESAVTTITSIEKKLPNMVPGEAALMASLLTPCPEDRASAKLALQSEYFSVRPRPKQESLFPTFPSKAGLEGRVYNEPKAPVRDKHY